jgi:hypothetical protein
MDSREIKKEEENKMRNQANSQNPLMIMSKIFLILLIGHLFQGFLQAQAQTAVVKPVDTKGAFRLSNDETGKEMFLTISENGDDLTMAEATRSVKQMWKVVPVDGDKTQVRIVSLSDELRSLSVEQVGDVYFAVMADFDDSEGQTWTYSTKGRKMRIINEFGGNLRSLDVDQDDECNVIVVLEDSGNKSGQMWTITKVSR